MSNSAKVCEATYIETIVSILKDYNIESNVCVTNVLVTVEFEYAQLKQFKQVVANLYLYDLATDCLCDGAHLEAPRRERWIDWEEIQPQYEAQVEEMEERRRERIERVHDIMKDAKQRIQAIEGGFCRFGEETDWEPKVVGCESIDIPEEYYAHGVLELSGKIVFKCSADSALYLAIKESCPLLKEETLGGDST